MQKFIAVILVLLLGNVIVPSHAQEDLEPCDILELATGVDDFLVDMQGTLATTAVDMDSTNINLTVIAIDSSVQAYWERYELAAADGLCLELNWVILQLGTVIDDAFIISQLAALSIAESDFQTYDDLVSARSAAMDDVTYAFGDTFTQLLAGEDIPELNLPECTASEQSVTTDMLLELLAIYKGDGVINPEITGEDLATFTLEYAQLSTEFQHDVLPILIPDCQEAQAFAEDVRQLLNQSLMVAASLRLAELEPDADIAADLTTGALLRYDELQVMLEHIAQR